MDLFGKYENDNAYKFKVKEFLKTFKNEEIIIWGKGILVSTLIKFNPSINIKYIVDIDENSYKEKFHNINVYPPEKLLSADKNRYKVFIAPMTYHKFEIVEHLNNAGFKNEDYCFMYDYILAHNYFVNNKIVIPFLDLVIQTVCTLKCKDCLAFIPSIKKQAYFSFEKTKKEIDNIFSSFDYIESFSLSTGEVLLHPNLIDILDYISTNYSKQYNRLRFVTNGTVLPQQKLLLALKKYNASLFISDYSNQINEKSKIDLLITLLKQFDIPYTYNHQLAGDSNSLQWNDLGDFKKTYKRSNEDNTNLYYKCADHTCTVTYNGNIYPCAPACYATLSEVYVPSSKKCYNEFISIASEKLDILKFFTRATKKGYPLICSKCKGLGPLVNNNLVPAGLQV